MSERHLLHGLSEQSTPTCSAHPERPAVSVNDMRTQAKCEECYAEWLELWRGLQ